MLLLQLTGLINSPLILFCCCCIASPAFAIKKEGKLLVLNVVRKAEQLLVNDISAPARAIVLLHVCAHNPTGVDPTLEQWEQIRQLVRSREITFLRQCLSGFY
ncbi:hypothetical protein ACFX1Q_032529 [Malus domestica]